MSAIDELFDLGYGSYEGFNVSEEGVWLRIDVALPALTTINLQPLLKRKAAILLASMGLYPPEQRVLIRLLFLRGEIVADTFAVPDGDAVSFDDYQFYEDGGVFGLLLVSGNQSVEFRGQRILLDVSEKSNKYEIYK